MKKKSKYTVGSGSRKGYVSEFQKDLEIVSEFSKKIGANISMTETIKSYYKELQTKGAGKLDTSSLLKRLDMLDEN